MRANPRACGPQWPSRRRILGGRRLVTPRVPDRRPRLMARLLRIACLIAAPVAAAATLGAVPATAQFFNPFEALFGAPPRPPSSVPSGRQAVPDQQQAYPQYPDQRYPGPRYPETQYPEQAY